MENFLMIESCKFEIDMMENDFNFETKMKMLDIQLMESAISEELYTEGVVENIKDFCNHVIEKIKEMFMKMKEAVHNKMLEIKFQNMTKNIKIAYAKNKSKLSGKKIKVFDYIKYRKDATNYIKLNHQMYMELSKKKFKSYEEALTFLDNYDKRVKIVDAADYWLMVDTGSALNKIDEYKKIWTDTITQMETLLVKEIEFVEELMATEAAKEATDENNISKVNIFKRCISKIQNMAKKMNAELERLNHLAKTSSDFRDGYYVGTFFGLELSASIATILFATHLAIKNG